MRAGERTLRRLLEPLGPWLEHPGTTEIVINRPGEVGVEQAGCWTWHQVPALTFPRLDAIGTLAAHMRSKDLGPQQPTCSSVLPDGQRIKICRPPAVPAGTISLTIRKRAASFTPTLSWLAERGYFAALDPAVDWVEIFADAVRTRCTIVICGEIGSSKTTFGEALLRAIPLEERIVTIEDTPEWLDLPHPNWVPLYYGDNGRGAVDCLQDALRMRPDWVPMQEMQDGQAWSFLRALMIGHPGITTVHAAHCEGAFDALALQIRQSESGRTLDDPSVRALLRRHIQIVAHCARGPYRVTEVLDLRGEQAKAG
jgi:type IV secretion system protein VirB11